MKPLFIFLILSLTTVSGFAQNILEAIQLKENFIAPYRVGELMATDTIIDLRNGYYEEYKSGEDGDRTVVRQAAIFHTNDGSQLLGISTSEWDFACFIDKTSFYEIPFAKDTITMIPSENILPDLKIREFVTDSNVFYIISKNLPKYRETYSAPNATIDDVLAQLYHIRYQLPQRGTEIIATLRVCDYLPLDEVPIGKDNWSVIENSFLSIKLEFDKTQKRFKKKSVIKKK